MFSLNEKVVYPGHGVARISCIVEKIIGDSTTSFFKLTFYNNDITILVSLDRLDKEGLRKLSSRKKITNALKILAEPIELNDDKSSLSWNRCSKEYWCKLRSGNLYDICKIYRHLKHMSCKKELSFAAKNLLNKAESLLAEEIAIVNNTQEDKTTEMLRSIFS